MEFDHVAGCFVGQALSEKEAEKTALTERILALQQEIEITAMETERQRRDFLSKQEQDKVQDSSKCST